jgi:hypothetical protein
LGDAHANRRFIVGPEPVAQRRGGESERLVGPSGGVEHECRFSSDGRALLVAVQGRS